MPQSKKLCFIITWEGLGWVTKTLCTRKEANAYSLWNNNLEFQGILEFLVYNRPLLCGSFKWTLAFLNNKDLIQHVGRPNVWWEQTCFCWCVYYWTGLPSRLIMLMIKPDLFILLWIQVLPVFEIFMFTFVHCLLCNWNWEIECCLMKVDCFMVVQLIQADIRLSYMTT
jgi:hypothetical protein